MEADQKNNPVLSLFKILEEKDILEKELMEAKEKLAISNFLMAYAINQLPGHELRLTDQFLKSDCWPMFEVQKDHDIFKNQLVFTSIEVKDSVC